MSLKKSQEEKEGDVDAIPQYISKFGFHCPTSCGLISMPNDWEDSWIVSFLSCQSCVAGISHSLFVYVGVASCPVFPSPTQI